MPTPAEDPPVPQFRSGAVAQMLRMPVSTLRVWERRYGLSSAAGGAGVPRMYSASDVDRLALLRQLSARGHAIGDLAGLPLPALQALAATHQRHAPARGDRPASATPPAPAARRPPADPAAPRPWRVRVDGPGLWARLQDPALRDALGLPVALSACEGDDVARRLAPPTGLEAAGNAGADALLVHVPTLHEPAARALGEAAQAWAPRPVAVMVGFAPKAHVEALEAAGIAVCRQTLDDRTLARWLRSVARHRDDAASAAVDGPGLDGAGPGSRKRRVPPRRYDDATLARFAGLSTTVACECPRHVAELLMQLTAFEQYSAECQSRTPADAALHASLQQVAATARAMFESALEAVAVHEGIALPPPAVSAAAAGRSRP